MPKLPPPHAPQSRVRRDAARSHRLRAFAALIGLAALTATLALTQQPQSAPDPGATSQPRPATAIPPDPVRAPDANAQMQQHQPQSKQAKLDAANAARKKQIADEAAKLLQLATELKSEVDKTDKDTLSLKVIRKADSIEKLAKSVTQKMKLTAGAS